MRRRCGESIVDDRRQREAEAWVYRAIDTGKSVVDSALEWWKPLVGGIRACDEKTLDICPLHGDLSFGGWVLRLTIAPAV
jgi:hypothetical protein